MIHEQVQAWKQLKEWVSWIQDPLLRNAMMAEFRNRAINEWGYCPDDRNSTRSDKPALDEWERDFMNGLESYQEFGVDTRTAEREQETKEARARMRMFVEEGGSLSKIPENIRTPFITKLYYEALHDVGDQLINRLIEIG